MRVLFDHATPVPIRAFLIGHTVRTAAQEHWDTLKNGELLTVAERAGFEVFLTTDKNMGINRTWPAGPLRSSSSAFSNGQPFNRTSHSSWPPSTTRRLAASLTWIFRSTDHPPGKRAVSGRVWTRIPQYSAGNQPRWRRSARVQPN